jgi:hypothetical protein
VNDDEFDDLDDTHDNMDTNKKNDKETNVKSPKMDDYANEGIKIVAHDQPVDDIKAFQYPFHIAHLYVVAEKLVDRDNDTYNEQTLKWKEFLESKITLQGEGEDLVEIVEFLESKVTLPLASTMPNSWGRSVLLNVVIEEFQGSKVRLLYSSSLPRVHRSCMYCSLC